MMSIENVLKLDEKQLAVLLKWYDSLPPLTYKEEDEDVCLSGQRYTLKYYETGIGPVIIISTTVNGNTYSVHLEYDDDGRVVGEYYHDH